MIPGAGLSLAFTLCVAVAVALLAFPASTASQPSDALDRARQLNAEVVRRYQDGHYADAIPLAREALALREAALGPHHPDVAQSLNNLAQLLSATGDYAGARPLAERVLRINEQAFGAAHPAVATSLDNLAALLHALGDRAAARPLAERAVGITENALGAQHPSLAIRLGNLAEILRAEGDFAGARPLAERALRISETALGPDHFDVGVRLGNLAALLEGLGEFAAARPLYERALRIAETGLGTSHPIVGNRLNNLAGLLLEMGEYAAARPMYERALRITEQALGRDHPTVGNRLNNLAVLLREMGEYVTALPLAERALHITERALGPTHPDVGIRLTSLAGLLQDAGDYEGARPLAERALRLTEAAFGPDHPDVALRLNNLAGLLRHLGNDRDARVLYERALSINERALGPTHPAVATSLDNLAALVQATGDVASARPLAERALAITETALGANHPILATRLNNLAALRSATGDLATARAFYERALRIVEAALGPDHPSIGTSLTNLAALLAMTGETPRARLLYERARGIDAAINRANLDLGDEALRGFRQSATAALGSYVGLLASIARDPARDPSAATPAAHAFLVAEQVRGRAAQTALARAGARAAADQPATMALARHVQDLAGRRDAARKQLVAEYGRAHGRDAARLAALHQTLGSVERELHAATERLSVAFPAYGELTVPQPIDAAAAQRLLRDDEAMVSVFTLDDRVLLWLLRRDRPLAYRDIAMKRDDLQALVGRVRASLDQSANAAIGSGRLAPFDVVGAHALYRVLLAPFERDLAGVTSLIVVPDDVVLPLPFGALLTKDDDDAYRTLAAREADLKGQDFAEYAKLTWLARDYAITVLPSATSLRALRSRARTRIAATEPFIGFGDPVLGGSHSRRGGARMMARGAAILDELRRLDALPGTRDELQAVGRALGADPAQAIFLGARATKPEVFALDAAGRLGRARVLSFATHGLLAGDIVGLRQPALVLTPPSTMRPEDDGLLRLDDVMQLRLESTDWVVLSACNTGAADGSGEGLSGLARAFFFAGAPTLLVSHWSVDDRATQALMTDVFQQWISGGSGSRAAALRAGMLTLMRRAQGPTAYFAHPFAWASFFLVGEGG